MTPDAEIARTIHALLGLMFLTIGLAGIADCLLESLRDYLLRRLQHRSKT